MKEILTILKQLDDDITVAELQVNVVTKEEYLKRLKRQRALLEEIKELCKTPSKDSNNN